MDLDSGFVNSIFIISKDRQKLLDAFRQVPSSLIKDSTAKGVYNFIKARYTNSGKFPSREAITFKFPEFEITKPNDDYSFYAEELNRRVKYTLMTNELNSLQEMLFSKNIEEAEKGLYSLSFKMGNLNQSAELTYRQTMAERFERYVQIRDTSPGMVGHPTGIPMLDKHLGGLTSEMFVIMGPTGVGKTFFMLMIAAHLWLTRGLRLVIVSNELVPNMMYSRMDAILAQINYSKYRKGLLSPQEEDKLLAIEELINRLPEMLVLRGAGRSVTEVEYEVLSREPELLCVDGLYLTDMGYNDQIKNTMMASRAYQQLIKKYEIPTLLTTQMQGDGETKYARAIQEDADIVLKMWQTIADSKHNQMNFAFTKVREESKDLAWMSNWDFDGWDFSAIDTTKPNRKLETEYKG